MLLYYHNLVPGSKLKTSTIPTTAPLTFVFDVFKREQNFSSRFSFARCYTTRSIILDLSKWDYAEDVLADRWRAPNTRTAGHKRFRPTIELTTNTSRWSHCLIVVRGSLSAWRRSYARPSRGWYRLTVPIAPGVSTITSSNCILNDPVDFIILFDL